MLNMDLAGLTLAGNSFSAKRAKYKRWMHTYHKQVVQYDTILSPRSWLRYKRSRIAARSGNLARPDPTPESSAASTSSSSSPRVTTIGSTCCARHPGLQPLVDAWAVLQPAVLLNHHLLRCYAVTTDAPQKQEAHREHPRPGAYLTYLAVDDGADPRFTDELVLLNEQKTSVARYPLRAGSCVVMAADILHQLVRATPTDTAGRLLVVFKSLAAIQ